MVEINNRAGHAPGIYLGMPEEEYHADPAFSASGVKLMTVSPLDYWVSKNKPQPEDSTAKMLGKAYHKILLEGEEAFEASFCTAPSKADFPDAMDGARALYARCKELGIKGMSNAKISELCAAIREIDSVISLWPEIEAEFEQERGARSVLKKDQWEAMMLARLVANRMPSAQGVFDGGESEVSLFWDDPLGVRMKARLDKLKPQSIIDLKTFGNIMQKDVVSAVANEVARNRYFIQPVVYTRGLKLIKELYRREGEAIIHGDGNREAVIAALENETRERFHFVFVQTGGVPNVIVREFQELETYKGLGGGQNLYWHKGEVEFRRGVELYKKCMEQFGPDEPWIADFGRKSFVDTDFPLWMLNSETAA